MAPADCPVLDRVGQVAARYPSRTAVVTAAETLDYRQLWFRVDQWRWRCVRLGLPPGSLVAVQTGAGAGLPAAFLGARAAGLVPVLLDGAQPPAQLAAVRAAARPSALLRTEEGKVEPIAGQRPRLLPPGAGYVVFSSGTQGTPKGIVGSAAGLRHFIDWEIDTLGVGPGTRVAMLTSPAFDVVYRDLLLPLCAGAELHIAEQSVRSAPAAVLPWLAARSIEVLHAVPSLSARWLDAAERDGGASVPALRHTMFAGEPLLGRHVRRWRAVAPGTRVVNLYGPSETTLAKFHYEVPEDCGPGLQPVGGALPDTVVDLVPAGPAGQRAGPRRVVLATPHGSLGYLPDTCSAADLRRLRRERDVTRFQTQDRGSYDADGNLVIEGRLDSLVKRRGLFVDLMRIEAAAAKLPEVTAACCVQLSATGEIVLAVAGPAPAAVGALRRGLRAPLGADLPDRVVAVRSLPLLPGGKVDRRAVGELLGIEAPEEPDELEELEEAVDERQAS